MQTLLMSGDISDFLGCHPNTTRKKLKGITPVYVDGKRKVYHKDQILALKNGDDQPDMSHVTVLSSNDLLQRGVPLHVVNELSEGGGHKIKNFVFFIESELPPMDVSPLSDREFFTLVDVSHLWGVSRGVANKRLKAVTPIMKAGRYAVYHRSQILEGDTTPMPNIVTVSQLANRWKLSERDIQRFCRENKIPHHYAGNFIFFIDNEIAETEKISKKKTYGYSNLQQYKEFVDENVEGGGYRVIGRDYAYKELQTALVVSRRLYQQLKSDRQLKTITRKIVINNIAREVTFEGRFVFRSINRVALAKISTRKHYFPIHILLDGENGRIRRNVIINGKKARVRYWNTGDHAPIYDKKFTVSY